MFYHDPSDGGFYAPPNPEPTSPVRPLFFSEPSPPSSPPIPYSHPPSYYTDLLARLSADQNPEASDSSSSYLDVGLDMLEMLEAERSPTNFANHQAGQLVSSPTIPNSHSRSYSTDLLPSPSADEYSESSDSSSSYPDVGLEMLAADRSLTNFANYQGGQLAASPAAPG